MKLLLASAHTKSAAGLVIYEKYSSAPQAGRNEQNFSVHQTKTTV